MSDACVQTGISKTANRNGFNAVSDGRLYSCVAFVS